MGRKTARLVQKHPSQWLNSPSRTTSAALHTVGLASFAYSFRYLIGNPSPISDSYGWHLQYLTIIGLSMATMTFTVGLLADITLSRTLFRVKNVAAVLSTPLEVLVSILYWTLRTVDSRLVVPPDFPQLSLPDDASFHAVPAIVLTIDLLLLSPPWTISFVPAAILSTVLAFGYWFWLELCFSYNGFYPYPLLDQLDRTGRIALFGMSAAVFTASTFGLKKVQGYVAGSERSGRVSG